VVAAACFARLETVVAERVAAPRPESVKRVWWRSRRSKASRANVMGGVERGKPRATTRRVKVLGKMASAQSKISSNRGRRHRRHSRGIAHRQLGASQRSDDGCSRPTPSSGHESDTRADVVVSPSERTAKRDWKPRGGPILRQETSDNRADVARLSQTKVVNATWSPKRATTRRVMRLKHRPKPGRCHAALIERDRSYRDEKSRYHPVAMWRESTTIERS